MRDILEVVRLIRVMEDKDIPKEEKIEQIRMVNANGDITTDEALEIVFEYFD